MRLLVGTVAVLLIATASHYTNFAFALEHDLGSQMQTAKATALAGMKKVMGSVNSGGIHAGVQTAKSVMGSALHGSLNSTNTETATATKKSSLSQLRTANGVAQKGMNEVRTSIKSEGLHSGVQTAKNVMGSALSGEYDGTTEQSSITSQLSNDIKEIEITSENFGNEAFSFLDSIVKEIHP